MRPVRKRHALERRSRFSKRAALAVTAALSCSLVLAGCGSNPPQAEGAVGDSSGEARAAQTKVTEDKALHALLPKKNRTSGRLISVNGGSFPRVRGRRLGRRHSLTGASADLSVALGQLLGVTVGPCDRATACQPS